MCDLHASWVAVNRYYDPTTGQFLSLDRDLDETGRRHARTETTGLKVQIRRTGLVIERLRAPVLPKSACGARGRAHEALLVDDDCSVKYHVRSPNALDAGGKSESLTSGEGPANSARDERNPSGRRKKDGPVRIDQRHWRGYRDAWRKWPVPLAFADDRDGFEGDGIADGGL